MRIKLKQSMNRKETLHNHVAQPTRLWSKYVVEKDAAT